MGAGVSGRERRPPLAFNVFAETPYIYGSNIATLVEKGTPGEAMHFFTTS